MDERTRYQTYLRGCPTTQVLDLIGDRWASLAVCALGTAEEETLRYSDLGRRIPGVSQKMLTQTLRSLERDGMVDRTVILSVPVRVDYRLTDLGRSLYQLLLGMRSWADAHIEQISRAREHHDARPAGTS